MTQHSPGPWEWSDYGGFKSLNAPNGHALLRYTVDDDGVHCENPHDAPLIAAAPDMLEALEECVAFTGAHGGPFAKARAAIAKARNT